MLDFASARGQPLHNLNGFTTAEGQHCTSPLSSPDGVAVRPTAGYSPPRRKCGTRRHGLAARRPRGLRAEMWPRCAATTHRTVHTVPECLSATHGDADVPQATGEAGPLLAPGLREAGTSGTGLRGKAQASAAPRGEAPAAHCVGAPRDACASRFDVAPVSAADLDAERRWSGGGCPEPADDKYAAQQQPGGKVRGAGRRRRVRAGQYPIGFSPYLMSANKRGGIIPLARVVIKKDLTVCTCAHVWSVA